MLKSTVRVNGVRELFTQKLVYIDLSETALQGIVKEEPRMLQAIEANKQTSTILMEAVSNMGVVLEFAKIDYNKAIALAAVNNDGKALQFVKQSLFSSTDLDEIELAACTQDYHALNFVREVTNTLVEAAFPV